MPSITILDGYTLNPGDLDWQLLTNLGSLTVHDRTPGELILSRSTGADILLTNKTPLTRATLEQLPDQFLGIFLRPGQEAGLFGHACCLL